MSRFWRGIYPNIAENAREPSVILTGADAIASPDFGGRAGGIRKRAARLPIGAGGAALRPVNPSLKLSTTFN